MTKAPFSRFAPARDQRLAAAADAITRGDLRTAETAIRARLHDHPDDVQALRLLAEVAARHGRFADAEAMLEQAIAHDPGFDAGRLALAMLLHRLGRTEAALAHVDQLLAGDPDHVAHRVLKAAMLNRLGDYEGSLALYRAVLAANPAHARTWMSYGHTLKTMGRAADAIAAYETAITTAPELGEAWWNLANMKTYRFTPGNIAAMQAALARPGLPDSDRLHLDFALGKALEDAGEYRASFDHYAAGNATRRRQLRWDPKINHDHVLASEALLTPEFFAARAGQGHAAADPIFIVGLPRSGSTLIEQILASHSQVEGTMELVDIAAIARGLGKPVGGRTYLDDLATLDAAALRALGQDYLDRTRVQRKADRPRFIDKMPNNFTYTGLIHLILPNAVIIDARRHPMATCFSAWKQHFAHGQAYTYDLNELGRFYSDYVRLMAHYDRVLPGRVLRVDHEALVGDPGPQIRRILAHCGLDFEAACLAPHETDRAVRTPSSEQVRQPITAAGIDQWRHYEAWLGDLKAALAA